MRIFLALALVTCSVVLGVDGATKNVAIPKPGTACTDKITFPVKALKGVKGYPGNVEVFGIPIIYGSKFVDKIGIKKLNHAASVMAELLDQDSDGCVDDPNVLRNLHMNAASKDLRAHGYRMRKAFILANKKPVKAAAKDAMMKVAMTNSKKIGFKSTTDVAFSDIKPQYSVQQMCNKTVCNKDNSIEEVYHFITQFGYSKAYSKIFGINWKAPSSLSKAMDIARGKRMKVAPKKLSGYPKNAWSRYADPGCDYFCQGTEYLWWGYCSYSGTCAGRSGQGSKWTGSIMNQPDSALNDQEKEFKLLKKTQLAKIDKLLYKLYDASAKKTAVYRLPTKPVDGTYTGCKKCLRKGGMSHGGK